MKRYLPVLMACALALSAAAEPRLKVDVEFFNTILTDEGLNGCLYFQSGTAGVAIRNQGSRLVRGELVLDFSQVGGTTNQITAPELKRLYIRAGFGDALVSLGKTRSTWGAGFAFNAGDILFGSSSVDFNARSSEPRSETAWLTNLELPLGDFSFLEIIALPGNVADSQIPGLNDASAGLRLAAEAGPINVQAGYLYRGDRIAGLGEPGHHAFMSLEGIVPVNWHLSMSARSGLAEFSTRDIEDNWVITGGAFYDYTIGYDMNLSWRLEALVKPYASFRDDASNDYGLYLYPSIGFTPGGTVTWSFSSVISPVDVSTNITVGASWNIYEELILQAYASLQAGDRGDVFNLSNTGGMQLSVGARYSY